MTRRTYLALLPLLLLVASGCGGPRILKVSGRVTYKGEPVPNMTVSFFPEQGRTCWGRTDDDGNFTMHFDKDQDGVIAGRNTVTIAYTPMSMDEEMGKTRPKLHKDFKEIVKKYSDQKTSPLSFDISKNGQFVEINLD